MFVTSKVLSKHYSEIVVFSTIKMSTLAWHFLCLTLQKTVFRSLPFHNWTQFGEQIASLDHLLPFSNGNRHITIIRKWPNSYLLTPSLYVWLDRELTRAQFNQPIFWECLPLWLIRNPLWSPLGFSQSHTKARLIVASNK